MSSHAVFLHSCTPLSPLRGRDGPVTPQQCLIVRLSTVRLSDRPYRTGKDGTKKVDRQLETRGGLGGDEYRIKANTK